MRKIKMLCTLLFISMYYQVIYAELNHYDIVIESYTQSQLRSLKLAAKKQHIENLSIGYIIQWTALYLLNSKYVPYLLDKHTPEYLYISLTSTDCMLFIEEVIAVSLGIKSNTLNMANYIDNIQKIRYHGKNINYCNRNHYFKDWAISNKLLFKDIGYELTKNIYPYKVSYISSKLKLNSHDTNYNYLDCILQREELINKQVLGMIPINKLSQYLKYIQPGDIIGIVRDTNHADYVQHLGIAYVNNSQVGLIHASSLKKKVILTQSLVKYLEQYSNTQGIILLRVLQ